MPHRLKYSVLLTISIGLLLSACSADRKNILSKAYHNTTARYNAYFYAKQRMQEINEILKNSYDNDYSKVLKIYPTIDSTIVNSYQDQIDDCIKKASIAIQRHKNSKWVDDSYIYIGMARHRSLDYVNSIETYKFVNTKSDDDDARHEALSRLIRTFVDYQEYDNATAVEDYLNKEKLNKKNQKIFFLNKAHHYQIVNDPDKMVSNLVKAVPLLKKRDGKGRIYFIIGQVYQQLGFDAEAFNYYKKCIASNPSYELDFYSRLNMAQVTELSSSNDVKDARKVLETLLKDSKNKDFKDRIYYEMAEFEFKQNNIEEAVILFQQSAKEADRNPRQRGLSFLRIGELNYDSLRSYEMAQAYYDSAVQSLPEDYDNLETIKSRADILDEFVKQLKTIELQDSLLALSYLDSTTLAERLNGIIENEKLEEEKRKKREEAKKRARRTTAIVSNQNSGIQFTGWYFDNAAAVAQGESEFERIWGNRQLEDNWRRSNKEVLDLEDAQNLNVSEDVNFSTAIDKDTLGLVDPIVGRYDELYKGIPFDEVTRQEALDMIEDAFYNLGSIYKFDLEEDLNAALAFEQLISRFPQTEYYPEALYQLYLIYKSQDDPIHNQYKEQLLKNYPNTVYAKLIDNPNYREESTATNEKLKKEYEIAYKLFSDHYYDSANQAIDAALKKYDETAFTANLKLLKVMITGKTEDISVYQYQLGEFIKNNPDSEIIPFAEKLVKASQNFQERKRKRLGTQYVKYLEQSHYFVYVYESSSALSDAISGSIENYNNQHVEQDINTSNIILDENLAMVLVSDFPDKEAAMEYHSKITEADPFNEKVRNSKFYKFVITKDNFNIFYQTKDLDAYLKFFEKNYLNEFN